MISFYVPAPDRAINTYLTATDNAFILVISKGALITNANKCSRSHIAIADGAFPVTFVAKSSYSNS
jgi:hypothetical protein